jgi:hypothetical protein
MKQIILDLHHRSLSYPPVGKIRTEDSVGVPPRYVSLESGKEDTLLDLDEEDFEIVSHFPAGISVVRYG